MPELVLGQSPYYPLLTGEREMKAKIRSSICTAIIAGFGCLLTPSPVHASPLASCESALEENYRQFAGNVAGIAVAKTFVCLHVDEAHSLLLTR